MPTELLYVGHFLIGSILIGFDFAYYNRSISHITDMFIINRIIFLLLWEIAVLIVAWKLINGEYSMGDFKA